MGVSKTFGSTRALDGAHLAAFSGEIHALMGENGAGKSTLVALAAGRLPMDSGEVRREGRLIALRSPRDSRGHGIALVPQHDLLVEAKTVADNLALLDPAARFLESTKRRRERVERLSALFGLDLGPPSARVETLPVGTRQRIEIAGALASDPQVLMLDEPTAILSPDEGDALFGALRRLANAGRAIVLITHRLAEVFRVADRLTLLARGRTVLACHVSETDPRTVAGLLLAGATAGFESGVHREALERPVAVDIDLDRGTKAAEIGSLESLAAHRAALPSADVGSRISTPNAPGLRLTDFRPRVASQANAPAVTLEVHAGELLVLLAIDGNGADTLAGAVAGVIPASGRIEIAGQTIEPGEPRAFRRAGGGFVPADRRAEGLVPSLSIAENLALGRADGFFLNRRALAEEARSRIGRFGIRASGPSARASELSGGNQQKLVLARELVPLPKVLVAIHPIRGLDIGATAEVVKRLAAARSAGTALLVVTSDPEEARSFEGTIRVVYRSRVSPPIKPSAPLDELGRYMAGLAA